MINAQILKEPWAVFANLVCPLATTSSSGNPFHIVVPMRNLAENALFAILHSVL